MTIRIPFCLLLCGLWSCGGSSSETPWPVEPQGAALDPAGESSATDDEEGLDKPVDSRENESGGSNQKRNGSPTPPER